MSEFRRRVGGQTPSLLLFALISIIELVTPLNPACAQSSIHYSPPSNVVYDTGLVVQTGKILTITASGQIKLSVGSEFITPAGRPGEQTVPGFPWVAPGLTVAALVGWIGAQGPFEIGTGATIHATTTGTLRLAVNDSALEHLVDNIGAWDVYVTVSSDPPVGLDEDSTRRATSSAIEGFLGQRANLLTSSGPDTSRLHRRLGSGTDFGDDGDPEQGASAGLTASPSMRGFVGTTSLRSSLGYSGSTMPEGGTGAIDRLSSILGSGMSAPRMPMEAYGSAAALAGC